MHAPASLHPCRYRHYRNLCSTALPKALREHVTEDQFQKAQAYGRDKARFGFVESVFGQIQSTLTLTLDWMPWLWAVSGDVMFRLAGYGRDYEVGRLFLSVVLIRSSLMYFYFSLPLSFSFSPRRVPMNR